MRTRVYFHFHHKNPVYLDNLVFFLTVAPHPGLELHVVTTAPLPVALPPSDAVRVHETRNENGDYGGFSELLRQEDPQESVTRIFLNCSVRGPFAAEPSEEVSALPWDRRLTDLLNDRTPLVGASVNVLGPRDAHGALRPHVQTYCYAMSPEGFRQLRAEGFFAPRPAMTRRALIETYEIGMSRIFLDRGARIDCVLAGYRGLDFGALTADPNPQSRGGDPLARRAFFGRTVTPADVPFFKTERHLCPPSVLAGHTARALTASRSPRLDDWEPARDLLRRTAPFARGPGLRGRLMDGRERAQHAFGLGRFASRYRR